jgi:acyl-CoA synthetase (AMP-forming)/AMP-acid ligase II
MLIGDIARRNGKHFPEKTAVVYEDQELSWSALDERANKLATFLLDQGLHPGDRVAVASRNTLEWPEVTFALAKAGLVLVPINVRLTASEATHIVEDSGCRGAIVHSDQVASLGAPLEGLDVRVEIGGSDFGVSYAKAIEQGRAVDPTPPGLTPSDIQFLLYTSGTTGRPKGVINEHRAILAQVLDTTIMTESRHNDVFLAMTPFFTAGGMIRTLAWLFLGQTMVIHRRFDPEATLDTIERRHITMTTFIPTMLLRTLRAIEEGATHDLSSLRRISYGSSPVPTGLAVETMERLGCDLQQRYGLTEAGGQVTILTPEDHRAMVAGKTSLATSCGREVPQAEIRIVDDDGEVLPPGEIGEIVIKADSLGRGYWNRPDETAATFRPNGLWSGDLGSLDAEGYLHIAGRKTDMIISGGFNIYPAELERVIGGHPNVDLVALVGVPDREWGETPVAVVVPKGEVPADFQDQLWELCRRDLAGYKQPRAFEFRSELPTGPAGKILKREIKTEYETRSDPT